MDDPRLGDAVSMIVALCSKQPSARTVCIVPTNHTQFADITLVNLNQTSITNHIQNLPKLLSRFK